MHHCSTNYPPFCALLILAFCAGKGTGVFGSLKSGDLAAAKPPKAAAAAATAKPAPGTNFKDIPLTTMRSVIAKRLLESKQNLPHYYTTVECTVDKVSEYF